MSQDIVPAGESTGVSGDLSLPVSAVPEGPRTRALAPTLLSGANSCSADVQVWHPERNRLRRLTAIWCLSTAFLAMWIGMMVFSCFLGSGALFILIQTWIGCLLPVSAIAVFYSTANWTAPRSLLRPCFVSTDREGLASASGSKTRSIRWTDVAACINVEGVKSLVIVPADEPRMFLNLAAYGADAQKRLCETVAERAELECRTVRRLPLPQAIVYARDGVVLRKGSGSFPFFSAIARPKCPLPAPGSAGAGPGQLKQPDP
jgi:hypothetical protein